MSYDQLSNLESGRQGGYTDDPAFKDLQYDLKNKLQSVISNNRKLSNDIKGVQSGYVRNYAFSMLIGVVVVLAGCLIGLSGMGR